ncbi:unnamed protein product [Rotaria sp. Silwood1]|nr:unnamed protein product [Rotaria sp. Silwood1]
MMIIMHCCECEQNYFQRHSRHVFSSKQKSNEESISKQSTNLFRDFYRTSDIDQKIEKYTQINPSLSTEFQLLQPIAYSYERLLQAVFSTIHESALAKPTMLDFCLQLYANNNRFADIRNFAENYRREDSIYWYTKESFIYRCVNQILRSGDIDKCYALRFYIADLSAQLHTLKYQQQKVLEKAGMTILYRGIRQSDEELNLLRDLVGLVVSVKTFMSTSRNKDIALTYASPFDWQAENSRPLLLEIYVDLSSPTVIAADIAGLSNFDEESEVLFDIGSTFRVDMLTFDMSNYTWLCRFIATNEKPACIQQVRTMPCNMSSCQLMLCGNDRVCSKTIRYEQGNANYKNLKSLSKDRQKLSWIAYKAIDWAYIRHIDCIIQWQQNDIDKIMTTCQHVLETYAQADVKDSFDDLQIASCINNYGYLNILWGNHIQTISLFKTSLNIRERYLPFDHILLAQSYRNLGLAYGNFCDYQTAFELHKHALSINQHASVAAQWSTVTTLRNMGDLYHRSSNCTKAIKYYSKALDTYYKCLNFFNSTEL